MSSKEDVTFLRYIFKDYNVLTFDFRAHGECTEHEFCTFGQEEKNDVIGAVEYIKKHPALKNKDIFVYGFSMGAVASILASYEKPNLFSGAIWDCPFDSTNGLINRALTKMKISLFGYNFTLPGSFLLKKIRLPPLHSTSFKIHVKIFSSYGCNKNKYCHKTSFSGGSYKKY